MKKLSNLNLSYSIAFLLVCPYCLFVDSQHLNDKDDVLSSTLGGILWENLTCVAQSGDTILNPSSGFVANGHVCGILGPSGSGKSTLMSIIAGRPEASLCVSGQVLHYYNENKSLHIASVLPDSVAWLQQQDAFFERLSVQETLDLAVFLEWPHLGKALRRDIAQGCLETLGLTNVLSRRIGSPKNARTSDGATLSGGELRRLSLALELVTNPHLLMVDEPTTGIDSKMSETVMSAISSLAKERNIPCFCTLHQPRSSIWHMLDSIILMAPGGRICYIGSQSASVPYFSSLGYECPEETNPAEYLIDLVSIDMENPEQATRDRERIQELAGAFAERNRGGGHNREVVSSMPSRHEFPKATPLRVVRCFGALFRRSWRQTVRSRGLNLFRMLVSTGTAILLSQIFPSVSVKGPPVSKSVSDRICVLSFGVINMFLISLVKTLGIFARERPVIRREKRRKDYTNLEYIVSKALAEFPLDATFALVFTSTLKLVTGLTIGWKQLSSVFALMTVAGASLGFALGSITHSEEGAVIMAMPVVIILMVVGVISPSGVDLAAATPRLVRWMKSFSPIASAIEGLVLAEFLGQKFVTPSIFDVQRYKDLPRMGGLALVKNGDETLEALGLKAVQFDSVLSHLATLSLINLGSCWLFLLLSDLGHMSKAGAFISQQKRKLTGTRKWQSSLINGPREKQKPASSIPLLRHDSSVCSNCMGNP